MKAIDKCRSCARDCKRVRTTTPARWSGEKRRRRSCRTCAPSSMRSWRTRKELGPYYRLSIEFMSCAWRLGSMIEGTICTKRSSTARSWRSSWATRKRPSKRVSEITIPCLPRRKRWIFIFIPLSCCHIGDGTALLQVTDDLENQVKQNKKLLENQQAMEKELALTKIEVSRLNTDNSLLQKKVKTIFLMLIVNSY